MEEDEAPVVIVCQGPPRCALQGDEAQAAMEAGCVWCTRITITEDGEHVDQPGAA